MTELLTASRLVEAGSEDARLVDITNLKLEMRERFHLYTEIQALSEGDRDALFRLLWDAQAGDPRALAAIFSLVYEEVPVGIEEFVLGRRYLGLKGQINIEKMEVLHLLTEPHRRMGYLGIGSGGGKALALDTPIPTPAGWTTMGTVAAGDPVLDEQGRPCWVVALSPIEQRPCFRVSFDDGTSLVTSDVHEWVALDYWARRKRTRKDPRYPHNDTADWRHNWADGRVVTTEQMASSAFIPKSESESTRNWAIPCSMPLVGAPVVLPVPPYALGAWLGDGTSIYPNLTVSYEDAPHTLAALAAVGVGSREIPSSRGLGASGHSIFLSNADGEVDKGAFRKGLLDLGVLGDKCVPAVVLRADYESRLAVLQGLMDTDGFVISSRSEVGIDLTCQKLADGVAELVRTFGWKARRSDKPAMLYGRHCGTVYKLRFCPDVPVFRLPRKLAACRKGATQRTRHTARWVTNVESVPMVPTRCIQVDSPSHLYLAGEAFIPTHNSFVVSILLAYQVYQLLCLRRPDLFYMLGPGSKIAAINLSINKKQAQDVVFSEFVARISHAPWFAGKYTALLSKAFFPKNGQPEAIAAISGGSSPAAYYGYHTIFGAIDEASFLMDGERCVAEELTEALKKSLATRFPRAYRLVIISTFRAPEDFLYQEIQRIKENGVCLRAD